MNRLHKLLPENLYHSYVIESNDSDLIYSLLETLEKRGEIEKNSQDLLLEVYDSLTMEDSKKIKDWHSSKPVSGGKKICIISAKFINREAEQALLKVIEEPNTSTHFFIIVPDSSSLLDTILSRVHIIKDDSLNNYNEQNFAEEFYKSSPKIRIDKVGEMIKEFKDEDGSSGLRFKAISLVNGLERIVYEKWKKDIDNDSYKFIFEEIKNCRGYLSSPGASVKMILEHLALIL